MGINKMWDIFEPQEEDHSTVDYTYRMTRPNNFNNGQIWSPATVANVDFPITEQASFMDIHNSDINFLVQLVDSTTGPNYTTYAAGTAVALNPDFASLCSNRLEVMYNSSSLEITNVYNDRSTFVRTLMEYSYDYAQGQQGQDDLVILDGPGMTQTIGTNNNPFGLVASTSYGTGYGNTALGSGNLMIPVTNSTGTLGPNNITETISQTTTYNPAFWKRQALTDAGAMLAIRVPIRRICDFFEGYDHVVTGGTLLLRVYIQSQINKLFMTGPGVNPAALRIVDLQLAMPMAKPALIVQPALYASLATGKNQIFKCKAYRTDKLQAIPAGQSQYDITTTSPSKKVNYIVLTFLPGPIDTASTQVNQNCQYSQAPYPQGATNSYVATVGSNNLFVSAYVQVGNKQFPQSPYGQYVSDMNRQYKAYKSCAARLEYDSLSPILNYNTWLQSYYLLVFDCSHNDEDAGGSGMSTNITVHLQAFQAWSASNITIPYITYVTERTSLLSALDNKISLIEK